MLKDDHPVYAPHETRMLALQMAVEFVNGDKRKVEYTAADVVANAEFSGFAHAERRATECCLLN